MEAKFVNISKLGKNNSQLGYFVVHISLINTIPFFQPIFLSSLTPCVTASKDSMIELK